MFWTTSEEKHSRRSGGNVLVFFLIAWRMSLSGVICHLLEKYIDFALFLLWGFQLTLSYFTFPGTYLIFSSSIFFFNFIFLISFMFSKLQAYALSPRKLNLMIAISSVFFGFLVTQTLGLVWGQTVPMQTSSFTKKKTKSLSGHTWSNIFLL